MLYIFTTHPIQYQVPVFQELEKQGMGLHVYFASAHSVKGEFDKGFSQNVKWDLPLLEGYESTFLLNKGRGHKSDNFFSYYCPEVKQVLEEGRPDAVLIPAYNRYFYLQVIFWCSHFRIPLYFRGNNMDGTGPMRLGARQLIRKMILRKLYKKFDGVFSIGSYMTKHYLAHGIPKELIELTPYCNNSKLFVRMSKDNQAHREHIRKVFGISKGSFVIMTSGRFIPWKRIDLIIKAIAQAKEKVPLFLIALGDGPERSSLLKLMQQQLPGVHLAPGFVNQSELGRYYACADAFILASDHYHETWGLVVNEAQTFSLPCIVSDGVGCRVDLIENSNAGLTFPAGNLKALVQAIETLAGNPSLARSMGLRGYKTVVDHSIENSAARIISFLNHRKNGQRD